jgi:hypothetical protein
VRAYTLMVVPLPIILQTARIQTLVNTDFWHPWMFKKESSERDFFQLEVRNFRSTS